MAERGARRIRAAAFKAVRLRLVHRSGARGEEFVITKRNRPVAKLGPVTEAGLRPFVGRSRGVISADAAELMAPIGDLHAWVRDQREYHGARVLAVDARLEVDCTRPPLRVRTRDAKEHRDPADRFIVAAARRLNGIFLTCDDEILAYAEQGHVRAHDAGSRRSGSH